MKSKRIHPTPDGYSRIPPNHYLMGLDVSSSVAGWCLAHADDRGVVHFDDFGRIKPPSSWSAERRMEKITLEIGDLCKDYSQTRDLSVVMEWQSHLRAAGNRNANGLAVLGKSQGAVWWHLKTLGFKIDLVSEREWTRVNGWPARKIDRAKKIRMLCPQYRELVEKDPGLDSGLDIADALGIILYRMTV